MGCRTRRAQRHLRPVHPCLTALGCCCAVALFAGDSSSQAAEDAARPKVKSGVAKQDSPTQEKRPLAAPSPDRGKARRSKQEQGDKEAGKPEKPAAEKLTDRQILRGQELYERLLRSTAWVAINKSGDWDEVAWGTGWLLDRDKKRIVTNHHVVWGDGAIHRDEQFRVFFPERLNGQLILNRGRYLERGTGHKAKVFDSDSRRDLAVLELETLPDDVVPLKLAAASIGPGEAVYQLGNPSASEAMWLFTSGTVRQVYRASMKYDNGQLCDFLRVETQSPTNPGDSGGPVVNEQGELVAIHSGSSSAGRLMTYFVDASELKAFLKELAPLFDAKTAQELCNRGSHYYDRGRYDRAIADFTAAVRLDPKSSEAIAKRGRALYQLDDYDTAIADFDEAIRLNANEASYYEGRGLVRLAREEYEPAISDLTQAIRRAPQEAKYYHGRGEVYHEQESYASAVKDYTRAIELAPDHAEYYNCRGVSYAADGDHGKAVTDFSEAIRRKPAEPQYYFNRATSYHEDRKDDEAALDCFRMERIDPEFAKERKNDYEVRSLKVTNHTDKTVVVWLKYYTRTTEGNWKWFPSAPDNNKWATYTFAPGESSYLDHEEWRVNAARVRISANTQDNKITWQKHEGADLVLVEEKYSSYFMATYEYVLE